MPPTLPAPAHLQACPGPGRLRLQAMLPGVAPAGMQAAGRAALRRLRARLLAPQGGRSRRWLARLRGPAAPDLASLAVHAAEVSAGEWRGAERLVVSLTLANEAGDSAALSWWLEGEEEMLRWSSRGGLREDGSCLGRAAVAAALAG